jgi:uncharacterized Zn-finger protein
MARVNYVECSLCGKEYYLDRILSEALKSRPMQKLKCPFCKKEFNLEKKQEQ